MGNVSLLERCTLLEKVLGSRFRVGETHEQVGFYCYHFWHLDIEVLDSTWAKVGMDI
jgi:hypothetical protein